MPIGAAMSQERRRNGSWGTVWGRRSNKGPRGVKMGLQEAKRDGEQSIGVERS